MTAQNAPVGVLLIQLGTPDSTSVRDVRRYLREFLSDPRVIDLPAPARSLLLNVVILPFRPRRSAEAYRKIWTERGSPLIIHTEALADEVQELLGDGYRVAFGMRYREPSLAGAVDRLVAAGCTRIVAAPLFPQYASASTGSALEALLAEVGGRINVPDVTTIGWFYDHPGFVDSLARIARPALEELTDRGAPLEKVDSIREKAMDTDGVLDTHAIRTRYLSSGLQVDLHVQVDPEATVHTGHAIAGAVKARLLEDEDILDVIVHIEPHEK